MSCTRRRYGHLPNLDCTIPDFRQYVFPIVGGRKVEHLKGNIEALGVELTQQEIDEIEDTEDFDVGFPTSFLFGGKPYRTRYTTSDMPLVISNTPLESQPKPLVSCLFLLSIDRVLTIFSDYSAQARREVAQPLVRCVRERRNCRS